jgi:enediyne biosynthesis protein E4
MRIRHFVILLTVMACSSNNGGNAAQDTGPGADNITDLTVDRALTETITPDTTPELTMDTSELETGPEMPPDKCNEATFAWSEDPLFVEHSSDYELDENHLDVQGNLLVAVDLDNDFYPDLVVHKGGSNNRDAPEEGIFHRRILFNRESTTGRTFEDHTVTSNYGIIPDEGILGRAAHLAVFADVDNDGDFDAFSGTFCDRNSEVKVPDRSLILLNDGNGIFTPAPPSDVTPPLEEEWTTAGASFLDYDKDGNIDLWIGNWYYQYGYLNGLQDRLYKGHGDGTFTDVTIEAGLATTTSGYDEGTNHRPTFGTTACDINGDGYTDLLTSSYGRQFNTLWLNLGDGTFVDAAAATGFASDDNMDYSDNQFYACYCHAFDGACDPQPPAPLIQCQANYWSAQDAKSWRNGGNTFSTACSDLDNDLDNDLYNAEIVHWHIGQSSDPSQILLNEPADNEFGWAFSRPSREATGLERPRIGSWNEGDIYATIFDADADGWPDIFQPSSDYPETHGWLFTGNGDGTFSNADESTVSGLSLDRIGGMTVADFDRDGDLDTVIAYSTMRCDADCEFDKPVVRMYLNGLDKRANWTAIRLVGKGSGGSNKAGIGARVVITANGQSQMREINGGFGHMGIQNTLEAHFGLGNACLIDKLEIHWPDAHNSVSTFKNVPANYFLRVHEETQELEFL